MAVAVAIVNLLRLMVVIVTILVNKMWKKVNKIPFFILQLSITHYKHLFLKYSLVEGIGMFCCLNYYFQPYWEA